MKKTYINPQTLVVRVNVKSSVLIGSPSVSISTDNSASVNASSVDVKSSNYNVWDDDWNGE